MAGHANLPWRVSSSEKDAYVVGGTTPCAIVDADGIVLACNSSYYPTEIEEENAGFIVRAVNSHYALVEALKTAFERMPAPLDSSDMSPSARAYRKAKSALDKANQEDL